ncbi:hypothetical protein GCM10011371_21500 [Novosphingobium marinum]|uniref:DUF2975 domain-containing protein n=1 Tax=Novosphingobium marinum TaxID=1514948 RepID=A0A7Y9XZP7_9SPHN|nr:DUF2975 domain-containing protein [Novosphingobium marinum]NYH96263.1 hypothetical protein [Novosphingobium marinum]GGC33787.1 hypothetical protein GCM10011371_21500 [Novosphingobium marinum]
MNAITRDPLLAVAKGLLLFLMAVMAFAAVVCLVVIPAIWIFQSEVAIELAEKGADFPTSQFLLAVTLILALAAGLLAMLFRVFQLLKRIVDTVGEGDPFVPVNAGRLTSMAWLVLAIQVITIPMAGIGIWILNVTEEIRDKGDTVVMEGGVDMNGLLLVLVLFILARVFRKGAEMREELEGTV